MKQKHRILSKKNKKVKQLMRRFQDDSDDEQVAQKNQQSQRPGHAIKKHDKNQFKKGQSEQIQPQLKRKGSDRTNDSFDVQNQSNNESDHGDDNMDGSKPKSTFSSVFSKILNQDVKKTTSANPIFSDFNKPLKKVRSEIRKERENQLKKKIKELKERRGHVLPQSSPDGALYEKELKIQAAKGIIKILEAVKNYQDQEGIEN
ncbi:hypothetical protein ABPG74_006325 [Tetrahymena malaccensis]